MAHLDLAFPYGEYAVYVESFPDHDEFPLRMVFVVKVLKRGHEPVRSKFSTKYEEFNIMDKAFIELVQLHVKMCIRTLKKQTK